MAPQTWVARFVVDHGRVTEEGACLRSFERRRLDEPDADLFLLAEPSGEKGEDLAGQALEAIGRAFLQDRLSLTGGLLRALRSTHATLVDWNRRSIARDQVGVGVTGAIVSGPLVYLAQAGPGIAYLWQGGGLRRFSPQGGAVTALGEGELEPALRRFELQPGDILLGASTRLEGLVDGQHLGQLLARGSEEALPELYLLTRDLPSFALFAVSCLDPSGQEDESDAEPARTHSLAFDDAGAPSSPTIAPSPLRGISSGTTGRERAAALLVIAGTNGAHANGVTEPGAPQAGSALVVQPPLDISRPVVRLRPGLAPARTEYVRTTGSAGRFRLDSALPQLLVVVAALALVFFVGAFTVPDLIRQSRGEKLAAMIEGAQLQLAAAENEADPGLKRLHLEEARRLTNEALRIDSARPEATGLLERVNAALRAMDAVFDLGPLTTVATLNRQITGDLALTAVTTTATHAYLLDSKGGRVLALPLNPAGPPAVVFEQGQVYSGTTAKQPLFLTWQADPAPGRLLVLDQERKLFEVTAGSPPAPLPLRRTGAWASVAGIASYQGNLYVLDPKGEQVHRYLPAVAGFDSEPVPILSGPRNLQEAVGLAVSGDVYVYSKDGRVHRFSGGVDAGFSLAGIDRPLKSPSDMAIVRGSGSGEVFIADAGNKRVVVASPDGVFRRQFVSNAFTDLTAISLDPPGAQLYVIVGDSLMTAPVVR